MEFDRELIPPRIPQNVSATETARRLLNLPVPRKFDIARFRPAELPQGERFETMEDAQTLRDERLARFEGIAELVEIADRLFECDEETPCAEVSCPNLREVVSAMVYGARATASTWPRP